MRSRFSCIRPPGHKHRSYLGLQTLSIIVCSSCSFFITLLFGQQFSCFRSAVFPSDNRLHLPQKGTVSNALARPSVSSHATIRCGSALRVPSAAVAAPADPRWGHHVTAEAAHTNINQRTDDLIVLPFQHAPSRAPARRPTFPPFLPVSPVSRIPAGFSRRFARANSRDERSRSGRFLACQQ